LIDVSHYYYLVVVRTHAQALSADLLHRGAGQQPERGGVQRARAADQAARTRP